ncbi:DNA polymerase III subunit delta [Planctomycetota bacterium]
MKIDAFLRLSPKKTSVPVVVVEGEEDFFKEEAIRAVYAAMPGAERLKVQGDARDMDPARVLDELRTSSLFSSTKIVVVREAQPFVQSVGEAVASFAEAAFAGRTLILDLKKLDRRTRLAKRVKNAGHIVECKRLFAEVAPWHSGPAWDTELARWVVKRLGERGKAIGTEEAYHLTLITGSGLFEIDATVEKLSLLLGGRDRVTDGDIEAVAGHTCRNSTFAVAEAIADRDSLRALQLLHTAFRVGMTTGKGVITDASGVAIVCLGSIHRKLDELRRVRHHLERDGSTDTRTLATAVGIAPFAARRAIRQARAFQTVDLEGCYRALLRCDLGIKGRAGGPAALERLVVELEACGR